MGVLPFGGHMFGSGGLGSGFVEGMKAGAQIDASQVDTEIKRETLKQKKEDRAKLEEINQLKGFKHLWDNGKTDEALMSMPAQMRDQVLSKVATGGENGSTAWAATPESRQAMRDAWSSAVIAMDKGDINGAVGQLNVALGDQINIGSADNGKPAAKKEIIGAVRSPTYEKDGTFFINTRVTRDDGTTYEAPITANRSGDPKDTVRKFTLNEVANYVKGRADVATMIDARLISLGDEQTMKDAAQKIKGASMAKALESYDPKLSSEENRRNVGAQMYRGGATSSDVGTVIPSMIPKDEYELQKLHQGGNVMQDTWVNKRNMQQMGTAGGAYDDANLLNAQRGLSSDKRADLNAEKQRHSIFMAELKDVNKSIQQTTFELNKAQATIGKFKKSYQDGVLGPEEKFVYEEAVRNYEPMKKSLAELSARKESLSSYLAEQGMDREAAMLGGGVLPAGSSQSNNMGNLRSGPNSFQRFTTPEEGVAAAANNLRKNYRGLTLAQIGNKWAPPSDGNNTASWVNNVARASGLDPNAKPNLDDPVTLEKLAYGIMVAEKSEADRQRFTPDIIKAGVNRSITGARSAATSGQGLIDTGTPSGLQSNPESPVGPTSDDIAQTKTTGGTTAAPSVGEKRQSKRTGEVQRWDGKTWVTVVKPKS